jgi:hypothetical protein
VAGTVVQFSGAIHAPGTVVTFALQRYLTRGAVERAVRPLLAMEEFTAGG